MEWQSYHSYAETFHIVPDGHPTANQERAAQIKLLEVWKSVHVEDYSIELEPYNKIRPLNNHDLRTQTNRVFNDSARLKIASQSFSIDAARIWNLGPASITESNTITMAKRAIKKFVMTLPI